MKRFRQILSLALSACLLFGLTIPLAAATGDTAVVSVVSNGTLAGSHTYTDLHQVERLITLLPDQNQRVDAAGVSVASAPVRLQITRLGTTAQYDFYMEGFVKELQGGQTNWYSCDPGLWYLLIFLSDWKPHQLSKEIRYKGKTVTELYSFEYKSYSYHKVTDTDKVAQVVKMLEEKKPDETAVNGNVGFLVFCGEEKFPLYFDAASEKELVDLSVECNATYPNLMQWVAYSSPEKVETVRFSGTVGKDFSLANSAPMSVGLYTADRDSIHRIMSFLKSTVVGSEPVAADDFGINTTPDLYRLEMKFDTGATMSLTGNDSNIIVSHSDMPFSIGYRCSGMQLQILRDLISVMYGAEITPWP